MKMIERFFVGLSLAAEAFEFVMKTGTVCDFVAVQAHTEPEKNAELSADSKANQSLTSEKETSEMLINRDWDDFTGGRSVK